MSGKWKNPLVARSEKKIAAGVDKAVSASLQDERQLELGSDKSGKLVVKAQNSVEQLPRAE